MKLAMLAMSNETFYLIFKHCGPHKKMSIFAKVTPPFVFFQVTVCSVTNVVLTLKSVQYCQVRLKITIFMIRQCPNATISTLLCPFSGSRANLMKKDVLKAGSLRYRSTTLPIFSDAQCLKITEKVSFNIASKSTFTF